MDFPSPKLNIEKLQTYKPNFGKSKINNLKNETNANKVSINPSFKN